MKYAVISNLGVVQNIIIWDGEQKWSPPYDTIVVNCGEQVSIGWSYQNNTFHAPQVQE